MDYLRSCYETDMVLVQGGPPVHVRWYFVPDTNPVIRKHSFGSLNWIKPDAPTDHIGEVVGASRSWVDGSFPAWLKPNPTHSRTGLLDWYVTGAPPGFSVTAGFNWEGKRAFPPSPVDTGIFPPAETSVSATLVSSIYGPLGGINFPPGEHQPGWFRNPPGGGTIYYYFFDSNKNLFKCGTGGLVTTLHVNRQILFDGRFGPLQCTSSGASSTWIDPTNTLLDPGEVLTLTP